MPVTGITHDIENRSLTITAQFAAPVERVWGLYADPRQLERIWGPPTHPATFVDHDLSVGGRMTYYMTSPEGEKFAGWWLLTEVDEPYQFRFEDGFADESFEPVTTMPVSHNTYTFEPHDGGTRATFTSVFDSADDLQRVLDMGMEQGATLAINQVDALLAA